MSAVHHSYQATGRMALAAIGTLMMVGLTACSGVPQRYQGEVVATESANVATCQYLGEVGASSGLSGLFAPKGVDNIKQVLLQRADALGATHVVWDKSSAGYVSTSLTGKTYRCQPSGEPAKK